MQEILMPIGTAYWLKNNTKLTDRQISQFCNLSIMFVNSLSNKKMVEFCPLGISITLEEIKRCEKDPSSKLTPMKISTPKIKGIPIKKKAGIVKWFIENGLKETKKLILELKTTQSFFDRVASDKTIDLIHPSIVGFTEKDIKKFLQ